MKSILKQLLVIISLLICSIVSGQCDNGANYYPPSVYDPLPGGWGYPSTCNWAGEVIQLNIIAGDSYQFSTCAERGGVQASYDTQLSLRDGAGTLLAYNDDFSGCSGFTSYLFWTATYTGVAYLHLNEYYCADNFVCTEVMIYREESIALPITLLSFNATAIKDGVHVEWSTASQMNNDYFNVQKSLDGYEWENKVTVEGAGNSNTQIDYSWVDLNPSMGVSYYRLKQTDYDGQFEIFDPVSVIIRREEPTLIRRSTILGRDVIDGYKGMVIEYYSDGSVVKTIQ